MSYAWCIGTCWVCHGLFQFNMDLVPSVVVQGVREPICQRCVDAANILRAKAGTDPIVPLPGAYEPQETDY